jgi:hypothetical protein
MEGMQHGGMQMGSGRPGTAGMEHGATEQAEHGAAMHELHTRMMRDPTIRERIMADPELRRLMQRMMEEMPDAEHEETGKPAESPRHDRSQQN